MDPYHSMSDYNDSTSNKGRTDLVSFPRENDENSSNNLYLFSNNEADSQSGEDYSYSNEDNFYVYFNRPNDIDASTIAINSGDYNITTEETGDYIYFWAYMVKSSSEEYNRSFQIDITTSNE